MTRGTIFLSLLVCAAMSSCTRSKPSAEEPAIDKPLAEEPVVESKGAQAAQSGEVHEAPDALPVDTVGEGVSTFGTLDVLQPGDGDVEAHPGGTTGAGEGASEGASGGAGSAPGDPEAGMGDATAAGDLDKNTIREHIRRVLPRITSCYEAELLNNPTLAGRVIVRFTIAPSGAVAQASAQGVDDKVASCVADVIKSIQFPRPAWGGFVEVSYPFSFQPAGG